MREHCSLFPTVKMLRPDIFQLISVERMDLLDPLDVRYGS